MPNTTYAYTSVFIIEMILMVWLLYRYRRNTVTPATWAIALALGIAALDPVIYTAGLPGGWLYQLNPALPALTYYLVIITWPVALRMFQLYIDGIPLAKTWYKLRRQAMLLVAVVACLCVLTIIAAITTQPVNLFSTGHHTPLTNVFGVVARGYVAYVLADVCCWSLDRKRRRAADTPTRLGLGLLGLGLASHAVVIGLLSLGSFLGLLGLEVSMPLTVGIVLNIVGGLGELCGVCIPLTASRYVWLRLWWPFWRLESLWTALHDLHPEDELADTGLDRSTVAGMRFALNRRLAEISDGLGRLGPELAGEANPQSDHAAWLVEVIRRYDPAPKQPGQPLESSQLTTTVQDETRRLMTISAGVRQARRKGNIE